MDERLSELTDITFTEASNHFEAQSARDATVRTSGALRSLAVSLIKIADDIRWLSSGPRLGLGELSIPAVQPGSSIMPGKINPVIAEALIQAAAQVVGARNLLEQIQLLTNSVTVFSEKLITGLSANREGISALVERSLSLATALAPRIGYDRAAGIAKRANAEGKTVREIAMDEKVLPEVELRRILDPKQQTRPDQL